MDEKDILTKEEPKSPIFIENDVEPTIERKSDIEVLFEPQKMEASVQSNLMNPNYQMTEETIEKPQENNYKEMYELQTTIKDLNKKLKERKLAMALPAVFSLIIIINVIWFLGVHFVILPKYEENSKLNETMKKDYESLKSKVDAIVGDHDK